MPDKSLFDTALSAFVTVGGFGLLIFLNSDEWRVIRDRRRARR